MSSPPERGLPPRIFIPVFVVIAAIFLLLMFYLLRVGFGVTGSPFGIDVNASRAPQTEGPRSTR